MLDTVKSLATRKWKARRGEIRVSAALLFTIFLAAIIFTLVWVLAPKTIIPWTESFLKQFGVIQGEVGYNEQIAGTVKVYKPVQFTVKDELGGSDIQSATIEIYNDQGVQIENLVTDASGQATTTDSYWTGQTLRIKVSYGGMVIFYEFVVPGMDEYSAQSSNINGPHTLFFVKKGTWSFSVFDSAGNSYTSGGNINKTTLGNNVQLTITIYNTVDNTGYKSSYDFLNNMELYAILVVKVTGTNYETVVVKGLTFSIEKGQAMYFGERVPDQGLTKWKKSTGEYHEGYQGVWSLPIQLDLSGYSGDAADLIIELHILANWDNFTAKGTFGNLQSTEVTFTLNLVD